jgi:V/A-type H+-transporting ATPase subunit B
MKDGIGEGYTREDHPYVANQLFASYSRVQDVRGLAQIIGENDLSELDQAILAFGRRFEKEFVTQDQYVERSIDKSIEIGWDILRGLPRGELDRIDDEILDKYY